MGVAAIAALLRDGSQPGPPERRLQEIAADMAGWHALFEQQAPAAHETFLRSLGLAASEIEHIRSWSRRMGV